MRILCQWNGLMMNHVSPAHGVITLQNNSNVGLRLHVLFLKYENILELIQNFNQIKKLMKTSFMLNDLWSTAMFNRSLKPLGFKTSDIVLKISIYLEMDKYFCNINNMENNISYLKNCKISYALWYYIIVNWLNTRLLPLGSIYISLKNKQNNFKLKNVIWMRIGETL